MIGLDTVVLQIHTKTVGSGGRHEGGGGQHNPESKKAVPFTSSSQTVKVRGMQHGYPNMQRAKCPS